jgi:lysophospholipase L1-like esterase
MKKTTFPEVLVIISLCLSPFINRAQSIPSNQNLFDTIAFIPLHVKNRMVIFTSEPVVTGRIVFLGNSITEMGDWKKLTGDSTVLNRGISGDITFGVLKRLDEILNRKPSKIFLLIGINDIGKDIPPTVITDNIKKIIRRIEIESPSTKIFLQNLLPVNPSINRFPQHYDKQSKIVETNKLLIHVAKETNVTLVDLNKLFRDNKGNLQEKYTKDGLHLYPGGEGYKIWVDHLKSKGYL